MHMQSISNILTQMVNAQSVAIVGASSNPTKVGYMTLKTLIDAGYQGSIYPVNPQADTILGQKAYPSLSSIPGGVELVVVLVPAPYVADVLREAAGIGVKGVIILSAGFRESGFPEREAEIAAVAKETGLRFLGPNIQGITYVPNKLCAAFFPVIKTPGPLAIVSQSGSVTAALMEWADEEGLGVSAGINLGNQTDVDVSDILQFLAQDKSTKAIALYVEGLRDGRKFFETAAQTVKQKPIAVLKGGRSTAGKASVASHTGSLAGRDEVFSAACRQIGLVQAHDLDGLYDAAKGLATIPNLRGNRLMTISTSGGGNTLAADEAEKFGLTIPPLPKTSLQDFDEIGLPPNAGISNPMDLASLFAHHFVQAVTVADKHNIADVYLVVYGDPVEGSADAIRTLSESISGTLAVAYFGGGAIEKKDRLEIQRLGIPVFSTPERAARGIGAALKDAERRRLAE